ncbi:MAG: 2-amino-4-hydroxy-6-hydroxymethyldihydropteridine diphosphokinase [Gammaproteobacteria bacterium]|nr:2-amino-4-hydroxy-6-hydroxymethyldihydropteridine diphosphokinase [Gammaproteobacteria bacterium]
MPRVFVGIGSNIDREAMVRAAVAALHAQHGEVQLSSVYESEAVGFEGDAFFNLVAAYDTEQPVDAVIAALSAIEDQLGRQRTGERFASRTVDLDLLLYGDQLLTGQGYNIPRDEIPRYAFVLWPLAEIAPDQLHPALGQSYSRLWQAFDKKNQPLRPIPFQW